MEEKKITCDLRDRWVENLRSGKYRKGTAHLERNGRYCCLGVLCVTAGVELTAFRGEALPPVRYRVYQDDNLTAIVNGPAFGIPEEQIDRLWRMNDGADEKQLPFSEIADWIQENVECE